MSKYKVVSDDNDSIFKIFIDHVKEPKDENSNHEYDTEDIDFDGVRV